jgi:S1-C subfamily serine protease
MSAIIPYNPSQRITTFLRGFAALAFLAIAAAAGANENIYRQTLQSTAWVITSDGQGSGVVVDASKKILATNYHVVGSNDEVAVVFPAMENGAVLAEREHYDRKLDDLKIRGRVIRRDPRRDLALVELDRIPEGVKAVELATQPAEPGQQVHSIGNPGVSGALWVYSTGTIRQVYAKHFPVDAGFVVEARIVETQTPINPGDSGGPVVNAEGQLVAITSACRRDGSQVGLCIDVSELKALLAGDIKSVDRNLVEMLKKLGLKAKPNFLGRFRLDLQVDDEVLTVFVDSETWPLGQLKIRKVWAVVSEADQDPVFADMLLKLNRITTIGASEYIESGGKQYLVFAAKLPASNDAESLKATLIEVQNVALRLREILAAARMEHEALRPLKRETRS